MHAWTCVFGSFLCAGCAGATWVRGRGLESGMGAWKWCMASRVGGVPLVGSRFRRRGRVWALCGRAREGLGDAVSSRSAGWTYAWALGLVRHPVALSGLLLRWQSRTLGYCCEGEA